MSKGRDSEKMLSYTFRLPSDLLEGVKTKAGLVPVSRIIRELLKKWLRGEIQIDYISEDEELQD